MPPSCPTDIADYKSESTYVNTPEPKMSSPLPYELNDWGQRSHDSGATRPRGYEGWQYATPAQTVPGADEKAKKNRFYATLCCGSPLGIILWLLLGAGLATVVAILLVKAFNPSTFGAAHAEAISTTSSMAERSTTTLTVSSTAPPVSTTTLLTLSTETRTTVSTTTQTTTTEEETTATVTYTPPTTATETETAFATSISMQTITTQVEESFRTVPTTVTQSTSVPTTITASTTATATATATATSLSTATTTQVTTSVEHHDDDDEEHTTGGRRRAMATPPNSYPISYWTSTYAGLQTDIERFSKESQLDTKVMSGVADMQRSLASNLNDARTWCSGVMTATKDLLDDETRGYCDGYDSKSAGTWLIEQKRAAVGAFPTSIEPSTSTPAIRTTTTTLTVTAMLPTAPLEQKRTIVAAVIPQHTVSPISPSGSCTTKQQHSTNRAIDAEASPPPPSNHRPSNLPVVINKRLLPANTNPPKVGTCVFFKGHVDCVKDPGWCVASLVGCGILGGLLAAGPSWWLCKKILGRLAGKSQAAPAPAAGEEAPPAAAGGR